MTIIQIKSFIKLTSPEFKKAAIILCLFFMAFAGRAQEVTATLSADTNTILIGGQFNIILNITHPSAVKVEWPVLSDTFSLLEVVKRFPIDTVPGNGEGMIKREQKILLTSFDSGFHVIPPIVVQYKKSGDTATYTSETRPLLITVNTIPVDTTKAIKDIKEQVSVPYTWRDFLPYIIGLILIAVAGYLLYKYFKNRKKLPVERSVQIVKRPAHEIALEALKELEDRKLWQQGNIKAYYTGLSDITRLFIENRWLVNALEMTTAEIMQIRIINSQRSDIITKLKSMLELSDLVKFAKVIPAPTDNEESIRQVYDFINANRSDIERKEDETA